MVIFDNTRIGESSSGITQSVPHRSSVAPVVPIATNVGEQSSPTFPTAEVISVQTTKQNSGVPMAEKAEKPMPFKRFLLYLFLAEFFGELMVLSVCTKHLPCPTVLGLLVILSLIRAGDYGEAAKGKFSEVARLKTVLLVLTISAIAGCVKYVDHVYEADAIPVSTLIRVNTTDTTPHHDR